VVPQGAHASPELMERLRKAPRRRDFKTVPMILDHLTASEFLLKVSAAEIDA
jgi:hypothetical protein